MATIRTDPPAFPRPGYYPFDGSESGDLLREKMDYMNTPQDGMSLRDYFAAAALTGLMADKSSDDDRFFGPDGRERAADEAYAIADAMLRARDGN